MNSFLAPTAILVSTVLAIVAVIMFIVTHVRNKDKSAVISIKFMLKTYLYLISYIALLIAAFGLTMTIKSGLSYIFRYDFSYNSYRPLFETTPESNSDVIVNDGTEYYVDNDIRERELVNGITLFISMGVIFLIHWIAAKFIDKDRLSSLYKSYLFGSLILYSILAIVIIPTSIYNLVNYLLERNKEVDIYARAVPGEYLAGLIVFVPLWVIYLLKVLRMHKQEEANKTVSLESNN